MGRVDRSTGRESHPSPLELAEAAARMRALDLVSIHAAGSGHPGGTLSVMDVAAVLYLDEARWDPADPGWDGRDRIFFSAGHKAPAMYAALVEQGRITAETAVTLRKLGSPCQGHPHAPLLPGVEVSSGSLGQGLGIAAGCALAARMAGGSGPAKWRAYCVMGDGEQQEGSIWEAAMSAGHYKLDNLCAIVDRNGLQIDGPVQKVMGVEPLADKYRAFGWNVLEVNGHDIRALQGAFAAARKAAGRPTVIIAATVKGKGVSFMEGQAGWHGVATKDEAELGRALAEIASPVFDAERVSRLLAHARAFQAGVEATLASELPRFSRDYWWNTGTDMRVEMKATRFGFGAAMAAMGDDPRVVTIHADISSSIAIAQFEKDHPERAGRVVSVGIAEQNMMSVAAGLALEGKIPVTGTYGVFAAGRPWDQVRTTICYDKLNVKIAGAHGGISVGADGATHQALEELSLMTVLPNMTVLVPCDAVETERLARIGILEIDGPVYLRYAREPTPMVTTPATPLALGTANVVRFRGRAASFAEAFQHLLADGYRGEGEAVALVACGPMVCEAMRAAWILAEEHGIQARVLDVHTVKPLDVEAIRRAGAECGAVLACEEHQRGGFGNIVAGALATDERARSAVRFDMVGVADRFGESGGCWELVKHFGLSAEHIAQRAARLVRSNAGPARAP